MQRGNRVKIREFFSKFIAASLLFSQIILLIGVSIQPVYADVVDIVPVSIVSSTVADGNVSRVRFTVPTNSDATTVNIYSATSKTFTANATTLVGSVEATPGIQQTFSHTAPDDTDRYFVIKLINTASNDETVNTRPDSSNISSTDETKIIADETTTPVIDTPIATNSPADSNDSNLGWFLIGAGGIVILAWLIMQQRTSEE